MSLGLLAVSAPAYCQILGTTARQLPKGSLKLLAYYQGTQGQDLNFTVNNSGSCSASGGAVSFACGQGGNVPVTGNGGMGVLKLLYQPWESFQYYAAFGVGDYSLSVPSATINNTLSGDNPGFMGTVGMRAVIYPDTQFSPAVALDGSISESRYTFNRRAPGGDPTKSGDINQALSMLQFQVAVEVSHLFTVKEAQKTVDKEHEVLLPPGFKIEPYGGVKWTRIQSDLHDLQDGSHAGGQQDTVTPFVGVRLPAYEHESFFAETTFVGGYQYAGGLELRF